MEKNVIERALLCSLFLDQVAILELQVVHTVLQAFRCFLHKQLMHTPQQIMMKDFAGILYSVMFQANRLHSIRQVRHASHLHVTLRIFLFHFLFHQDQVGPFITVKQIGKRFVNKPMIRAMCRSKENKKFAIEENASSLTKSWPG